MYRLLLLTILLCLKAASPAPQTRESDVTYVKIQPLGEDAPAEAATNIRESRIEKLPLTIPGNITNTDSKEPDKIPTEKSYYLSEEKPENLSDSKTDDLSENSSNLSENLEVSESNQSDKLSDASGTDEPGSDTTEDLSEISPTDVLSEPNSENLSDTVPSETNQSDRRARNFDSATTETAEDATEKYEDELIEGPRTRAPQKFVPKGPKLSYFQKPRVFQSYSSNLVENGGKKRFRSTCTCQKIWNCPKLQITVPRCPDEYFLCCS